MKKFVLLQRNAAFAFILLTLTATAANAQSFSYPDAVVYAGGNVTISPSTQDGFSSRTVTVSTDFKGVLTLENTPDKVRVTNAQPAGNHTITVSGFLSNGMPFTRNFTLRVLRLGCGSFNASNFTAMTTSPFTTRPLPQQNAILDFDHDSDQDIAAACFSATPNVTLLRNFININNSFSPLNLSPASNRTQHIAVADFNANGYADLLVSNHLENTVTILLNTGGVFDDNRNFFVGSNPRGVVAGDWNNDGYPDFAVVNTDNNAVSIFQRDNVNASFAQATGSPISVGTDIFGIARGDFNRDGNQDLAIPSAFEDTVMHILLGNGDGIFIEPMNSPFDISATARNVVVADFNNDGYQDLLTDSYGTDILTLLAGNVSGNFTASDIPVAHLSIGIAAADVNGDGNQDFLLSSSEPGSNNRTSLYLGNGNGTFTSAGFIGGMSQPTYISVGDVNNDNFLDAAITESGASRLSVRLGGCGTTITNNSPSLQNGQTGQEYSQQITVSGSAPQSFSAIGLPPGLTISSNGLISGMPTASGTFVVTVTATELAMRAPGDQISKQFQILILQPTAANVSVSGRTLTPEGYGLRNAIVTLTDAQGVTRSARTSTFGYFRFDDVAVGETYIIGVTSKRYQFAPQVIAVNDEVTDLILMPEALDAKTSSLKLPQF